VLTKCEWGKDDYSLEIKNLPASQPRPPADDDDRPRGRKAKKVVQPGPSLFDAPEAE